MNAQDTYTKELFEATVVQTNAVVITDTNARAGLKGYAVQVLAEAVIASIKYNEDPTSNTIAGVTLAAGLTLFLSNVQEITLTSGSVIVYQYK